MEGTQRRQPMIDFGVLLSEDSFGAADYVQYFDELLHSYDSDVNAILFLCGDNCNVNKSVANLMSKTLVGCAAHRLHVAVEAKLAEPANAALIDKVLELVKKLRTIKGAGKLRALGCHLCDLFLT